MRRHLVAIMCCTVLVACPRSTTGDAGSGRLELAVTPASLRTTAGTSVPAVVVVMAEGLTEAVTLSATTSPGLTATFDPPALSPEGGSAQLTLDVSPTAAFTAHTLEVRATSGGHSAAQPLTLTVDDPNARGFDLALMPGSVTVEQGGVAYVTVEITRRGGFTEPLELRLLNAPAQVAGAFSPAQVDDASTLTLTAEGSAAIGSTALTVEAVGPSDVGTRSAALALQVVAAVPPAAARIAFPAQEAVPSGSPGLPVAMAVADVNHDGLPDVVTALGNGDLSVLLRASARGFAAARVSRSSTSSPHDLVVGDLDADGNPDAVMVNASGLKTFTVAMGNGDGTFRTGVDRSVQSVALAGALGDVNGDAKLDLVLTSLNTGFAVMLGRGDGTFMPETLVSTNGASQAAIALVDMNGDGRLDAVTVNSLSKRVAVNLNTGSGAFGGPLSADLGGTSTTWGPRALHVGDLDGDGRRDVAVAIASQRAVDVLRGHGDGGLEARVTLTSSDGPLALTAADLGGDPRVELLVGGRSSLTVTSVGASGFGAPVVIAAGPMINALEAMEVDGQPGLDVVMLSDRGVVTLPGSPTGVLRGPLGFSTAFGQTSAMAGGDVDGDGRPDVVLAVGTQLVTLRGDRDGGFAAPAVSPGGSTALSGTIALGDLDSDGLLDAVRTSATNDAVLVALGRPDGGFLAITPPAAPATLCTAAALVDLDEDTKLDAVVAVHTSGVAVLRGKGDGGFMPAVISSSGGAARALAIADLNNDGHADVVTANAISNTVSVKLNDGHGVLGAAKVVNLGHALSMSGSPIVARDLDGDGNVDVVVGPRNAAHFDFLAGRGDGTLAAPVELAASDTFVLAVAADLDGDGRADLISGNARSFDVYFGSSTGLVPGGRFSVPGQGVGIVPMDVNRDGKLDVVLARVDGELVVFIQP